MIEPSKDEVIESLRVAVGKQAEIIDGLKAALTQSQAELAEVMEEIERLRAAIDHDVIADVNHFDPRTTHE